MANQPEAHIKQKTKTSYLSADNTTKRPPSPQSFNVIVGKGGVGKTWFLSKCGGYFLPVGMEAGQAGFAPDFNVERPLAKAPQTFTQLMEFMEEFTVFNERDPITRRPSKYPVLAIDSLAGVFNFVVEHVKSREKISQFDARDTWQRAYTVAHDCIVDFCKSMQRVRQATGAAVFMSAHMRTYTENSMLGGGKVRYGTIDLPYSQKTQEIADRIFQMSDRTWFMTSRAASFQRKVGSNVSSFYAEGERVFITREPTAQDDNKIGLIPKAKTRGVWPLIVPASWEALMNGASSIETFIKAAEGAIIGMPDGSEKDSFSERLAKCASEKDFIGLDSLIADVYEIARAPYIEAHDDTAPEGDQPSDPVDGSAENQSE